MVHYFSDQLAIDGRGCVGLWFQGLLGDAVLASMCFEHIQQLYPESAWIIVHSYGDPRRKDAVIELLEPLFASGRIKEYVYHYLRTNVPMPPEVRAFFRQCGVESVHDLMFTEHDRARMTAPALGLDLSKRKTNKAVLCRRSTWNPHFMLRNRPRDEWASVELAVMKAGYEASVVGVDDDMDVSDGVADRRGTMSVREVLDFTTDAGLVVSCTTFIPVFTQFVCPTLVICDPRDYEGQLNHWRLTERYNVYPAHEGYLEALLGSLPPPPSDGSQVSSDS